MPPAPNPSWDKPAPTVPEAQVTSGPGHEALRRGRWSCANAEYFLTICTRNRAVGLTAPTIASAFLDQTEQLEIEEHWSVRTAVVMPDHVHLLVALGQRTDLAGVIRLLKGRLTPALRAVNLSWERGYFDHRMRENEDKLPAFLYIFLNPYRAKLIASTKRWPAYYCCPGDWAWLEPLTSSACPFPEWLL